MMNSRLMLILAAISGFLFVILGAFGTHIFSTVLSDKDMNLIRTGLEYQGVHTLTMLFLAVAMQYQITIWFYWSGVFLSLGILLFSGSLYCLALSHLALWVYITPVGGICFLVGWILMLIGALHLKKKAKCHE